MNGYIEAGYVIVGASLVAYGGHLALQRHRLERRARRAFGAGTGSSPEGAAASVAASLHDAQASPSGAARGERAR